MIEYTLSEVYALSGVDYGDSELVVDFKISNWVGNRKCRCINSGISYSAELEKAAADGIEVLIIKD